MMVILSPPKGFSFHYYLVLCINQCLPIISLYSSMGCRHHCRFIVCYITPHFLKLFAWFWFVLL